MQDTYRVVEYSGWQQGCGRKYREVTAYIERVLDQKLVREVGPTSVKWGEEVRAKAQRMCLEMNQRAAGK